MTAADDITNPACSGDRGRLERIEQLLRRYPGLTESERDEVLDFLRTGSAAEQGLLGGGDALKPQLDRFWADHVRSPGIGRRELAIIGLLTAIVVAAVLLLWDAGIGE